jgi:phospholipase/carboxylesterase
MVVPHSKTHVTRRHLLTLAAGALPATISAAYGTQPSKGGTSVFKDTRQEVSRKEAREGILLARPTPVRHQAALGRQALQLGGTRDGLLYVPAGYRTDRPAPLALLLHGAGGHAHHGLALLQHFADVSGLILLAPESRRKTWDVILDAYGPDVAFIDRALAQTFQRYAVDPAHVAVGGFSDGASYALSLGLTNGDLLTHVIAFSPGFMAPTRQQGSPRLFISHGTHDQVLPIDHCSRRIVPQLRRAGYDVRYREFDGPHTILPAIAREAVEWFAWPRT